MTREWKPGDVADIHGSRAMRAERGYGPSRKPGWVWPDGLFSTDDETVTGSRPLVVIDPEDREQVERIVAGYEKVARLITPGNPGRADDFQAALREFANPKPPKPEEPGTWGVVEASCFHSDRRGKWIRHEDGNWWPAENYGSAVRRSEAGRDPRLPDDWADLIDPVIVREGVHA